MDFSNVQSSDNMSSLTIDVADDIRDHVREVYLQMFERCQELEDGMPNVVLPALTLVWLESVSSIFGSASYESAVSLLSTLRAGDRDTQRLMRRSAADLLRRSGWAIRRKRK